MNKYDRDLAFLFQRDVGKSMRPSYFKPFKIMMLRRRVGLSCDLTQDDVLSAAAVVNEARWMK